MARNKVDACMFCIGDCMCAPVKRSTKKPTAKVKEEIIELPESSTVTVKRTGAALKGTGVGPVIRAGTSMRVTRNALQVDTEKEVAKVQDEKDFRAALTALAPLLASHEIKRYKDKIDLPLWKIQVLIKQNGG